MIFAVEWGSGQVLWSIFWFFIFFLWIWLLITIFADIIRSHDLSGWGKALWAIAIIILPFLGVFLYLIVRGGSMGDRAAEQMQQQDEAQQAYIRSVTSGSSSADELQKLATLHANGTLSDDEYAAAKAKALS